jgi:hypothetical protein
MHGLIPPITSNGPTGALDYLIVSPASNQTLTVSNNNDYPLTLTLGAWSNPHFTWTTASPVVIAPHSSATVKVAHTTTSNETATASVPWTVDTGASGTAPATAEYDNNL